MPVVAAIIAAQASTTGQKGAPRSGALLTPGR
jgi:hypothetical protein